MPRTPLLLEPLPLRWLHPVRKKEGRSVYVVYGMDFVTALTASKQVSQGLHPRFRWMNRLILAKTTSKVLVVEERESTKKC